MALNPDNAVGQLNSNTVKRKTYEKKKTVDGKYSYKFYFTLHTSVINDVKLQNPP